MIAELTGTVVDHTEGAIVLNVGGIGYLVNVSKIPAHIDSEKALTLYTHLAVRENAMDLYGFGTKDERAMFELLITLPKVGPKSAMQIMSQADIELLREAVGKEDASYLSKMSGIGKKTAEKIVVELKDKLDLDILPDTDGNGGTDTDAVDALEALGYSPKAARDALAQLPEDITGTNERIKAALKHLSK